LIAVGGPDCRRWTVIAGPDPAIHLLQENARDGADVAPVTPFCYFVGRPRVEVKLQLRSLKSLTYRISSAVERRFCKAFRALPPYTAMTDVAANVR